MQATKNHFSKQRGFALVATLSLLILLTLLAVGMLSLSSVSLRNASRGDSMAVARANARLALMIAIGELQKEMGPDMRVSAESALLDMDEKTEAIEGVARSRWLASYDSWGNWLNASYTNPRTSANLTIQNTYQKGRRQMFRRWLLSLPPGQEIDIDAPVLATGMDDTNSVVLVGEGSLGASAGTNPDRVTRASLVKVGDKGRHAWWIGPENHKARIDMANKPRTLAVSDWETSQGDTAEVGVGALDGFKFLDTAPDLSGRLISHSTLEPAGASKDDTRNRFFDLTAHSKGVIASVRTGQLKRDLSLLFEQPNSALPAQFKFNTTDTREPSVRPMSPDLVAKTPKIPNRHFQSWTNMRHYYRMYRQSIGVSDATVSGTLGSGALKWDITKPWTDFTSPTRVTDATATVWKGSNHYLRMPVLAKLTYIHSLRAQRLSPASTTDLRCRLLLDYSPVLTFWNPYNTELRILDGQYTISSSVYRSWPISAEFFLNGVSQGPQAALIGVNTSTPLKSGTGGDVVFKPGEFRVFSLNRKFLSNDNNPVDLVPGFDPQVVSGQSFRIGQGILPGVFTKADNPGIMIRFSHSEFGGNVNNGNTPGSLDLVSYWGSDITNGIPLNYQIDWFKKDDTYAPITSPNPTQLAAWSFADENPLPVAYHQLVLKGLSKFGYESINWAQDWRGRNWIQSPPYYFGGGLYISENPATAHTQRIDSPYVVNFGPTSMAELPKLVFHNGPKAFLGSGSNPFEKVSSVAAMELPTVPISSLAGFSGMRINPGSSDPSLLNNPTVKVASYNPPGGLDTTTASMNGAYIKNLAYQSGVTGPGIGNSFMHPMLPRDDVYKYFNNSRSMDPYNRKLPLNCQENDNMFFNDYWDHVFLLNDTLWDDYFVSSLADQTRPGASTAKSLNENIARLVSDERLPNSRYLRQATGQTAAQTTAELQAADGYLKAARHLMVDGMFNVNSTSVAAWQALFAGIRERQAVYRDASGALKTIAVPTGKRIAITRFNTEVSDKEMADPGAGATMPDGSPGWSGVRFLDDQEILKLAEECVKQVKRRGPFLNFSEFINRRLSNDDLGIMGALQSAIDYDDASPQSGSINHRYKIGTGFMLKADDLIGNDPITGAPIVPEFATPEAAVGSRFAGIPGYVIQSDILKPIANSLAVRDDTFRIRAYGEALDAKGNVTARAWCEAIVQRTPEYCDPANSADIPIREIGTNGTIADSGNLNAGNLRFGRRFVIESFRWLSEKEV